LASKKIRFDEVGPRLKNEIVRLELQKVEVNKGEITGNIPVLDPQYGNVWTNINQETFESLGIQLNDKIEVEIYEESRLVLKRTLKYCRTFGEVKKGQELIYINSVGNVAIGINRGDFAEVNNVRSGKNWTIKLKPSSLVNS